MSRRTSAPASSLRPTRTFIIEGDEYDTAFFDKGPKFLHYFPDALILTHVEFDHADIYADLEAVKTAFKRLVNLVPRRGLLVAFDGSENVTECIAQSILPRSSATASSLNPHWQLRNLATRTARPNGRSGTTVSFGPRPRMRLAGEHNALNATAAAALAAGQGISREAIVTALASFKSVSVDSRYASHPGITIIDDFAHHPTAIRETLRALRSVYPDARLWAVLEPRSNTLRRKVLEDELVESLRLADHVILAGVYQQERIPEAERLHPEDVVDALNAAGTPAELHPDATEIVESIAPNLQIRRCCCHPLQRRLRWHL